MGLNDQSEKIHQAWVWIVREPLDSEQYRAAYEFLDGLGWPKDPYLKS